MFVNLDDMLSNGVWFIALWAPRCVENDVLVFVTRKVRLAIDVCILAEKHRSWNFTLLCAWLIEFGPLLPPMARRAHF